MKKWFSPVWGAIAVLVLWMAIARADVPRQQLTRPAISLPCQKELAAIRESMFRSSMGEALLGKQMMDENRFKYYVSRAHYVMHTEDLKPSPAACEVGNIKTLRIMASSWEYDYLIDGASLEAIKK